MASQDASRTLSSSESSVSSSDIAKVKDRLQNLSKRKLTKSVSNELEDCIQLLDEHSCADSQQPQDTTDSVSGYSVSNMPPTEVGMESGFNLPSNNMSLSSAAERDLIEEWKPLTPAEDDDGAFEFEENAGENEGNHIRHGEPQQAEDTTEGSLVAPQHQWEIPKEARRQLVKITSEDEVRKIEEGSLRTTVAAVYHHHHSTQKTVPVTEHPGSAASDSPSECDMLTNGYISVVLVTEAVAKILRTDLQFTMNTDAVTYWRSFCQMHENKAKIESLPSAETLIGMRHSLAHANTEYCFRLQDKSTVAPMCVLYKRAQAGMENDETTEKELIKVHECTVEQFTQMCATVRDVFLTWKLLAKYKPNEDKRHETLQHGVMEQMERERGETMPTPKDEIEAVEEEGQ